MTISNIAQDWATQFGLAVTPLFEKADTVNNGNHQVLLDGGYGSFALSVSEDQLWRTTNAADWAWSSNLPHHVTVTKNEVAIIRWDKANNPEVHSRASIEKQIDNFYNYLITDKVRSNRRVTDYALSLFRRLRSLVADARIEDKYSTDAFLAFLSCILQAHDSKSQNYSNHEILGKLSKAALDSLISEIAEPNTMLRPAKLLPSLAIRHASSEIFQEAHFELLSASNIDLFGYIGAPEVRINTRGGTHFTPPALARSITEQTLLQITNLLNRKQLIIHDPACGSGAFLHEALRTLRRMDYQGKIFLIGKDISYAAVSMANFTIQHSLSDWRPKGGVDINITVGNSLEAEWPMADVILMNPPFIAWAALDDKQREQMHEILGRELQGRGDLSMAFITKASTRLLDGGALGTLFPASLLTLQAASKWRMGLLDQANLRFIASLGDYGLFGYALVQVAVAVFASSQDQTNLNITALETGNNSEATGNAFRVLRRSNKNTIDSSGKSWSIFSTSSTYFEKRATWKLIHPKVETALKRLIDAGSLKVSDLFDVKQGLRTGSNKTFVLNDKQFKLIPEPEKKFFRKAILNESIQKCQINSKHWVFYPYNKSGLIIKTEAELLKKLPFYSEKYLLPAKAALAKRTNITETQRTNWWGLSRSGSTWAFKKGARIISKYFGGVGGIATDYEGEVIVVQGFAWFPKFSCSEETLSSESLLSAYMALMNSSYFMQLLELFAPHVAGGQFDLSPRYVNLIPVPNLLDLSLDEEAGKIIVELAKLGKEPRVEDSSWQLSVNRITERLYGGTIFDQE